MRNRKAEKEGRKERRREQKRREEGRQAGKNPYFHMHRSEMKSSSVAVSPPPSLPLDTQRLVSPRGQLGRGENTAALDLLFG